MKKPLVILISALALNAAAEISYRSTASGNWANAAIWNQPAAPINDTDSKIGIDMGGTFLLRTNAMGVSEFYDEVTNLIPADDDKNVSRHTVTSP